MATECSVSLWPTHSERTRARWDGDLNFSFVKSTGTQHTASSASFALAEGKGRPSSPSSSSSPQPNHFGTATRRKNEKKTEKFAKRTLGGWLRGVATHKTAGERAKKTEKMPALCCELCDSTAWAGENKKKSNIGAAKRVLCRRTGAKTNRRRKKEKIFVRFFL